MNTQQQDFEKLFRSELEKVKFEVSHKNFKLFMPVWLQIMHTSSLFELDCDAVSHGELIEQLVREDYEFTLFNISFLLNALTRKSPHDLGMSVTEYNGYLTLSKEMADQWNELVLPIRNKLVNKMQTQNALQMSNNGMNVIPGKR